MGHWILKSAVGGGAGIVQQPHSISVVEVGSRTMNNVRQTLATLRVTIQEAKLPAAGYRLGTSLHVKYSTDNGAAYGDFGVVAPDRTHDDPTHSYWVTTVDIPGVLVLEGTQQIKALAWAAIEELDPGPGAAVTSPEYDLAAIGLPAANLITAITIPAGAGGTFPYDVGTDPNGNQGWGWPSMTTDNSLAAADLNAAFIAITMQDLDSAGHAIGPEHIYGVIAVADGTWNWGGIMGPYGSQGDSYARTYPYPGGAAANIAAVRIRVYVMSRINASAWNDAACSTLQTQIAQPGGGVADHLDVTVAVGGVVPPAAIPGARVTGTVASATSATTVPASGVTGSLTASQIGSVNATSILGPITAGQIGSVNASSITGTVTASQIASVNASSITGTITASQISSVNASSITGTVTASQIASVNATSISGSVTASQISSVNATSITGVIVSSQLANNIIDSISKFAAGLTPIQNVNGLPGLPNGAYPVGCTVYNTFDGKLYRNASNAWNSSVAASDVTGTLGASQIGSVNTSSFVGLIVAAQISGVNASSITGTVTASQISSVNASSITGTLSSTQIGSVNASTITIGLIGDSQIGSLSASKLTAGTITASISINSPTITGGTISGSALSIATSYGTVSISSSVQGVWVASGGFVGNLTPAGLSIANGPYFSNLLYNSLTVGGSTGAPSILSTSGLTVANVSCVDSSGRFTGAGVYCPSYNVNCYTLTVGAGGISAGGYGGGTNDITIKDSVGGFCTLNGFAGRLSFKYGLYYGVI